MEKILESKMKIRFHDCDPFNHLNNSKYLDYIMTARGDQLIEHYNLDIYAIARQQGVGWVTAQTQIAYLVPAMVMEEVVIETKLTAYSEKSLMVEAGMWNGDKTSLKALMWTRLVHFNLRTQRSEIHTPDLMQFFQKVVLPLSPEATFEGRVKEFQNKLRTPVKSN
ncbi:MAG: acyl-CoA thioesterase [Cyclobacteriaceae bacterium]|nr:acyl-CoA thioesterase [Cyclobacteriaceae bacterium]